VIQPSSTAKFVSLLDLPRSILSAGQVVNIPAYYQGLDFLSSLPLITQQQSGSSNSGGGGGGMKQSVNNNRVDVNTNDDKDKEVHRVRKETHTEKKSFKKK
jgi:hypothetical protein